MPWISQRRIREMQAAHRAQLAGAKHETLEMAHANARLAARCADLRDELAELEGLTDTEVHLIGRLNRALRACARYRHDAAVQRTVIRGLDIQLGHALGYSRADMAKLDAKPGVAR